MSDVTRILSAIEQGDPSAAEQLLPLFYDELRKLAAQKMAHEKPGQTLQATALVHEAYVRLVDVDEAQQWNSRGHFFGAAAEAMRRILVDNARRKQALKRGGDIGRDGLAEACISAPVASVDLVTLDEALERLSKVDTKAAARRQAYEYGINLAYEAWNDGDRNRLSDLLLAQAEGSDEDLRGFEWRCLWSLYEKICRVEKAEPVQYVDSVAYSSDGRYLALASEDVIVLDRSTGELIELATNIDATHIAFSNSGSYILACRSDKKASAINVWSLPSQQKLNMSLGSASLSSVQWCPDDTLVAGVRPDGRIEMRRFPSGKLLWTSDVGHSQGSEDEFRLAFSPDGTLLASGSRDEKVRLWDTETGQRTAVAETGHWVEDLFFSPDGKTLCNRSQIQQQTADTR